MCTTDFYSTAKAAAAVLLSAFGVMMLSTAGAAPPATTNDPGSRTATQEQRVLSSCRVIDRPKHRIVQCRCTASLPVFSSVDANEVFRLLLPGSRSCRPAALPRK